MPSVWRPQRSPRSRGSQGRRGLALTAAAVLLTSIAPSVGLADTVILVDDTRVEGSVLALDERNLRLRTVRGDILVLPRERLASVHFDRPLPPLRVEVRCPVGDDEFNLLLNGESVIENVGLTPSVWVDVSPLLRNGNNELRPVVTNLLGGWAYRWQLRINGKVTVFSCGQPRVKGKSCTCCGLRGDEKGTVDGIDPVWLHVDREAGSVEILGR